MKNIFTIVLSIFLGSQLSFAKSSPEDVVERFVEEFIEAKNPEALDTLLTDDFVLETAGLKLNREAFKQFAQGNFAALPDLTARFKVIEATNDQIVLFETVNGTHTGAPAFLGFPTTNQKISFTVLHVMKIVGDRIAYDYAQADFGLTLAQLAGQAQALTHQ